MYTHVLPRTSYQQSLAKSVGDLQNVVESDRVAFRHEKSSLITNKVVTALRYVQEQKGISGILQSMLLEACYKSEITSADSADLCSSFALALMDEVLQLMAGGHAFKDIQQEVLQGLQSLRDALPPLVMPPTPEALQEAVRASVDSPILAAMVIETVHMAGLEGTILPEHTKSVTSSVELMNGYMFNVKPPPSFYNQSGKWKKDFPKVLIIDGIIEQVSEIHALLESLSRTKEPCVFITRGYGKEVIQTLKVNHDRRTLNIIPIQVPFDLEGINMINDMAIVCGAPMVSSLKGDIISSLRHEDLTTVDSVNCQGGKLTVLNSKTKEVVKTHAQGLMKKSESQGVEDVSELLLKRIRSLNSYCVRLRISSKSEQQMMYNLEAVDVGLRMVKTVMQHGLVDVRKLPSSDDIFGRALAKMTSKRNIKPALSVIAALQHGTSAALMACSADRAVIQTQ